MTRLVHLSQAYPLIFLPIALALLIITVRDILKNHGRNVKSLLFVVMLSFIAAGCTHLY